MRNICVQWWDSKPVHIWGDSSFWSSLSNPRVSNQLKNSRCLQPAHRGRTFCRDGHLPSTSCAFLPAGTLFWWSAVTQRRCNGTAPRMLWEERTMGREPGRVVRLLHLTASVPRPSQGLWNVLQVVLLHHGEPRHRSQKHHSPIPTRADAEKAECGGPYGVS